MKTIKLSFIPDGINTSSRLVKLTPTYECVVNKNKYYSRYVELMKSVLSSYYNSYTYQQKSYNVFVATGMNNEGQSQMKVVFTRPAMREFRWTSELYYRGLLRLYKAVQGIVYSLTH